MPRIDHPGVLSTTERTQPTLPEVVEQATPTKNLQPTLLELGDKPAPAPVAAAAEPAITTSRAPQLDAPMCFQCGNSMQRAGSCYVCSSCGATSGCS